MTTPITMSAEQLATLRGIMTSNNRPVQPLNGRQVVRSRVAEDDAG
jgi:carbonic anhydrase